MVKNIKKLIFFSLLLISTFNAFSFQNHEKTISRIFNDIINSMGFRGTIPPKLEIINKNQKM